jgi:hypothetical protein
VTLNIENRLAGAEPGEFSFLYISVVAANFFKTLPTCNSNAKEACKLICMTKQHAVTKVDLDLICKKKLFTKKLRHLFIASDK